MPNKLPSTRTLTNSAINAPGLGPGFECVCCVAPSQLMATRTSLSPHCNTTQPQKIVSLGVTPPWPVYLHARRLTVRTTVSSPRSRKVPGMAAQ
ncbi:hypothetical protein HaLaN_29434, partial [Haematococcus lacustris]